MQLAKGLFPKSARKCDVLASLLPRVIAALASYRASQLVLDLAQHLNYASEKYIPNQLVTANLSKVVKLSFNKCSMVKYSEL